MMNPSADQSIPPSQTIPIQLARVEGKLDTLIANGSDHEQRIRSLERWRYGLAGGLALSLSPEVVSLVQGSGLG